MDSEQFAQALAWARRYLEDAGKTATDVVTSGPWAEVSSIVEETKTDAGIVLDAESLAILRRFDPRAFLSLPESELAVGSTLFSTKELAATTQWLVAAFERLAREEETARADEAERRLAHRPGLRLGSRAVKAHTIRRGDYVTALRALRTSKHISKAERRLLEREELIALRGDELLVVAGLLEMARHDGALRVFGPARARMGSVVFDARLIVDDPRSGRRLEEFTRLIGFPAGPDGRTSRDAKRRALGALGSVSEGTRPVVVESIVMRGKKRHREFAIVKDVPVRESTLADGREVLELHGSLALGYWWGHILISPSRWEQARKAIGARYTDDAMKWADVYFRRLVFGVASEHTRKETPAADLAGGLPKRLKTAALLEELELEEYQAKRGRPHTAARLGKVLDFCVQAGSLMAWARDGAGYYKVWLPHPVEPPPAEKVVQGELSLVGLLESGNVTSGGNNVTSRGNNVTSGGNGRAGP